MVGQIRHFNSYFYRFAVLGSLVISLVFPNISNASSTEGSYRPSGGFEYGAIPGFRVAPEDIQTGGTSTILETNIDGDFEQDFLGCSGIDIFSYLNMSFEVGDIAENFTNYMKTQVAKFALSQLFMSPQLGAIFDTLQSLGGRKWDMFNANCDASIIRAEVADKIEQSIQHCIDRAGGDADAIRQCRDRDGTKTSREVVGWIKEGADKIENFAAAHGVLNENLLDTSFCDNGENTGACALAMFIPQMKICGKGDKSDECTNINEGGVATADALVDYPAMLEITQLARENIANSTVNVMDYATNEGGLTTTQMRITVDNAVMAKAEVDDIYAWGGEAMVMNSKGLENTHVSIFNFTDTPIQFGASDDEYTSKLISELKSFAQCSRVNPLLEASLFAEQLYEDWGVKVPESYYDGSDMQIKSMVKSMNNLGSIGSIVDESLGEAGVLLDTLVGCVTNHHIVLSTQSLIDIKVLPRADRENIIMAASQEAAITTVELMMRFIRHKMLNALAEMAANIKTHPVYENNTCDGKVLSPLEVAKKKHAGKTVTPCTDETWEKNTALLEMMKAQIEGIDNQLKSFQELHARRMRFAEIMTKAYEKINMSPVRRGYRNFIGK